MAERAGSGETDAPELPELSGVSNVLLLAPALGGHGDTACESLLTQSEPSETNLLVVTFKDTPQDWVDDWMADVGAPPVRGGIVSIGQAEAAIDDPAWAARTIENPSDLTGIGIELSELLSTVATASAETESLAIGFDSVTTLLQYADLQRAFRFLHVVTGRVKTADGVAHYHVDPEAHDQQTLATLKGLFDAVVEVDGDGTWTVTQ